MTITTVNAINNAWPGQVFAVAKASRSQTSTANMIGFWTATGIPGAGAAPTAAAVPTSATTGAIPFTNPTSGNTYLAYNTAAMNSGNALYLFYLVDRLVHSGGLDGTLATAQTTNLTSFPAITRPDSTGADTELFLEVYAALGSTATTASVSYTNSAGTSGRTGAATVQASLAVGQMLPVTLQAGDTGVRSVQSVTLAVSTGTVGNFGVTILKRITAIASIDRTRLPSTHDWVMLGLPRIYDDACLTPIVIAGVSTGDFVSHINLIQG